MDAIARHHPATVRSGVSGGHEIIPGCIASIARSPSTGRTRWEGSNWPRSSGPTNRYPWSFSSFARASASGVVDGKSAVDRGDTDPVDSRTSVREQRGSARRTSWPGRYRSWRGFLARFRMIEGSCNNRSTSRSVIAATLADIEAVEGSDERFSLTEDDPPAEAHLEHAKGQRLEQGRLGESPLPPDLVVIADESGGVAPTQGHLGLPSSPMTTPSPVAIA